MIDDKDRLIRIERRQQLIRCKALLAQLFVARGILAAGQLHAVFQSHCLVLEQLHARLRQKRGHARVVLVLIRIVPGEACENRLGQVVIAPACIGAVCTLHRGQRRGDAVGFGNCVKFVVKNIARNHDQVGLHIVHRLCGLFQISRVRAVSQMQVGQQNDRHIRPCALHRDRVIGHAQRVRVSHAVNTHRAHHRQCDAALHLPHALHLGKILFPHPPHGKQHDLDREDRQHEIQHPAQPVVAELLEGAVQPRGLVDRKAGQRGQGRKRIHHAKQHAERPRAADPVAAAGPAQHPMDNI